MLNDIRLHLDSDESTQSAHESALANSINDLHEANTAAFKQHIPSIGNVISQIPFERLSIFVNKQRQTNIVDFNTGKTLYGINTDKQIAEHVASWAYHSALLSLPSDQEQALQNAFGYGRQQQYADKITSELQNKAADTLVMLGLGKGTQLESLFSTGSSFPHQGIQHIVIYEPDWEIFRCSLSCFDWAGFLSFCQQRNIQLFMQVGNTLTNLYEDINELHAKLNAKQIVFYKHFNLPIYNSIVQSIKSKVWGKSIVETKPLTDHQTHFLHVFSGIENNDWQLVKQKHALFVKNMGLFEKYYPDIHEAYRDYKSTCWEPIENKINGQINLFNRQYSSYFSSQEPAAEGRALAQHFTKHPHLDGLIFGHSGDKLKHYIHNTFIRQVDTILGQAEEQKSQLPRTVKCLLVFGLGSAYQFNSLCEQHELKNLVICEPNPDLFYGALYAIDWEPIFENIEEKGYQLYINIGEASSRLFKDLMSQFLQMGPHVLNETYIMQAYYNPLLEQVLSEVRQQLKVIFSMGENFDHVAYGLAHTARALSNKVPALRYTPSQYLSYQQKQTPIFLVGNGPSLDDSIEIIKECRDTVIVVSCGTALQALYKNGITPDFHGEVEQNRANFDWATRINDRAYLKKISLISVNGIHPDTCRLYKNVLFAFKSGESSTQATLAALPENSFHRLDHAYPTVTNMAMSFFMALGFEQLYMVGVDLGFIHQDKHHSSASGYYENGKQIYDYKSVHAADLRVRGNRQEWVYTKTEFNISRMVMEQLLRDPHASPSNHVDCFNLSNGVFIDGTTPLLPESVLVMTTKDDKLATLQGLDKCFMSLNTDIYHIMRQSYNSDLLDKQLHELISLGDTALNNIAQLIDLTDAFSDLLYRARVKGKSLFFYYFFNSIHFLTAALNKVSLQSDDKKALAEGSEILHLWRIFLDDATRFINRAKELIDSAEAYSDKREKNMLALSGNTQYYSPNTKMQELAARWQDTENNGTFSCISSINEATTRLLIDLSCQQDLEQVLEWFKEQNNLESLRQKGISVGFVFHHFDMLLSFKKEHAAHTQYSCLLYCSPCLDALENKESFAQGQQDGLYYEQYFLFLQARSLDLKSFSLILGKPRFSKLGAKNANTNFTHYTHKTSVDASTEIADKNQANNEYKSVAVNTIEKQICENFKASSTYVFKHYLACLQEDSSSKQVELSLLDSMENRALLFERPLYAHELLGQWQDS